MEQGVRPRDNSHTIKADLALTQAQATADPALIESRYRQALEAAVEGISAEPRNPKSYFQAGQAYVGLNNYVGADSMLTKAEELHPPYVAETEPWREQGWVSAFNEAIDPLNNGDLEGAAKLFSEAANLYDGRPEAHLQLGSVYSQLDRTDEAVAAYREAMDILVETREAQMADTATAAIWQEHWDLATTGLGQTLTFANRHQEAADFYSELLVDDPDNATLIGELATSLSQLGMADSVQVLYDKLLSNPTLSERDFFNAGVGLYLIENYEVAAQAFRRAAELNPFNRDARLNLAQTFSMSESFEELIPASRDLIDVDPRNALGWIYLTRALSETGQTEEANQVFQEYQSFGYEVEQLTVRLNPDGGATITGSLKNTSLEPGTTVTLRFHLGSLQGTEVGTVDAQIQAPAVEQLQVFRAEFVSTESVSGFRYEVISP